MIIIPVSRNFGNQTAAEQNATVEQLQLRAASAGLKGTVVVAWESGRDRMSFIAPTPWHPFFRSINMATIASNINKSLSW